MLGAVFYVVQPVQGESNSTACRVASTTRVTVGHQASTQIIDRKDNRAFTRISQPANATNTVSISLSDGTAATLLNGELLVKASTTPGFNSIEFGLNTDNPYVGAVTALSDTGSTSLIVTNCLY